MNATSLVTARAVILHPNADTVLTRDGELPEVAYEGHLYHGSAVPDLFAAFGPLTFLRRLAYRHVSAGDGEPVRVDAVFALAAHSADLPEGGAWTKLEDLTGEHRDDARVALAPDPRVPWWNRGWFQAALGWADGVLLSYGLKRTDEPVLVKAWQASALYRLTVGEAVYYLKAVPACFALEAALTRWLHTLLPGAAPRVLAVRDASLFLMAGVPGHDFLEADTPAVLQVLAATQRQAETRTRELFDLGCPDRNPTVLARQVGALLGAAESSRDEAGGLTAAEVARLLELEPRWLDMCKRLANSPIPLTLVHGDMHGGNVVTGRAGVTLLDWSDASVGFPFLDANVFYFLGPESSPEQQAAARDGYLSAWSDLLPLEELRSLYRDAIALGELHRALSYQHYITPALPDQEEWRGLQLWHLKRALELAEGKTWTWLGFRF